MKRRAFRLTAALTGMLVVSLVASTGWAAYRTTIGPRQCCKSHCGHTMPSRDAKQCCRTHPAPIPATTSHIDEGHALAMAAVTSPPLAITPAVHAAPRVAVRRGPPGATLLALHTSLAL